MTGFVTPGAIVTAIVGFVTAGLSMAFNPFFAVSAIALILGIATVRGARSISNDVAQGVLRIVGVISIMGALGGAVALAYPGLGVTPA